MAQGKTSFCAVVHISLPPSLPVLVMFASPKKSEPISAHSSYSEVVEVNHTFKEKIHMF